MSRNKKLMQGYKEDGFVVPDDTSEIDIFVQSDNSTANSNRSTNRGSDSDASTSVATVADHIAWRPLPLRPHDVCFSTMKPVAKER